MSKVVNGKRIVRNPMTRSEVDAIIKDACSRAGYPGLAEKITWEFNPRFTRKLGCAYYKRNHIELSSKLFSLADPWEREDTIRHEVAHLAVALKYPDRLFLPKRHPLRIMPHGYEWKAMARKVGATPKACSKKIEGADEVRGNRRRFPGYCGCGDHKLTKTIYRRVTQGARYSCRTCKCPITLQPNQANQQPTAMAADTVKDEIERLKKENATLRGQRTLDPDLLKVYNALTYKGVRNQDVRKATGLDGPDCFRYLNYLVSTGQARKTGYRFSTRYHRA